MAAPHTVPTVPSPHLTLVRDEDAAPYDGQSKAERNGSGHITMVRDDVLDEIASTLGLQALGLYAYLERRVNEDGRCGVSYSRIADDTKTSRRHIIDLIKILADAGYIRVTTPPDAQRTHQSNTFTLPLHCKKAPPELVQDMHQASARAGERASAQSAPKVVTSNTQVTTPLPPTSQNGHAPTVAASSDEYITFFGDENVKQLSAWLQELDRTFGGVGWVRNTLRDLWRDVPGLSPPQLKAGLSIGYERFEQRYQANRDSITSVTGLARTVLRDALREQQA